MRVAITGGAGFIGSHVTDRLVDDGHDVVVIDPAGPHRGDVEHRSADIRDVVSMRRATRGCDALFHLAAVSNVNEAFARPIDAIQINVAGTATVCEAALRNEIERVILASTVWVYAAAVGDEPFAEDSAFRLPGVDHIYTSSKLASEMVVRNYATLYGLDFTILRYGIPFGPRMRDELVIPRFVQRALAGEAITIQGDGSQYRNYVYVEDLADAHARVLGDAARNEVFNLEGAEPVSVVRIVECIGKLVGHPIGVESAPARPGDFAGYEVSADKARRLLGWRPTTSFEDGLRRYLDWLLEEDADEEHTGRVTAYTS